MTFKKLFSLVLLVLCGALNVVAQDAVVAGDQITSEALGFAELFADQLHDVDVPHFIVPADVVNLALSPFADDQVNGAAVILHVEPVAHILAGAVNRQGLVVQSIGDHEGDQLLGEVIGTIVVGTSRNGHR